MGSTGAGNSSDYLSKTTGGRGVKGDGFEGRLRLLKASLAGVEINAKLKEPFDVLLGDELRMASQTGAPVRKSKRPTGKNAYGSTSPLQVQGLSNTLMVDLEGHNTNRDEFVLGIPRRQ